MKMTRLALSTSKRRRVMAKPDSSPRDRLFRLSLREMLALVALVALAIASLKYANDVWVAIVAAVVMIALFSALIVAVMDRGPRQAFAMGAALTMVAYGMVLSTGHRTREGYSRNIEFDQWEGRLPTTRLLRYVYKVVDNGYYFDQRTGKVIPNYDPNTPRPNDPGFIGGGFAFGPVASRMEIPPREKFMPVGHCWWALILGYAGGQFARFVYWRRLRDEQKLPAETS
jgi:hypothetical protein